MENDSSCPHRRFLAADGRKMEKNHHMLDMGGQGHVTMGSELGLDWFQDQPKWEIPGKVNNNSFRRRNIDFFRQNVILVWRNLTRNP